MARWTKNNAIWNGLTDTQKAAAMSLMEAGLGNVDDAQHAAGAMVNRASKYGQSLGDHVSGSIYQPTIEPRHEARLSKIISSPQFKNMSEWVDMRMNGEIPDNVNGATHFLAHPRVMLDLEAQNPSKYKNWGPRGANWTGYDEKTGKYANQTFEDRSHAFLAPEGRYSHASTAVASAKEPAATDAKPVAVVENTAVASAAETPAKTESTPVQTTRTAPTETAKTEIPSEMIEIQPSITAATNNQSSGGGLLSGLFDGNTQADAGNKTGGGLLSGLFDGNTQADAGNKTGNQQDVDQSALQAQQVDLANRQALAAVMQARQPNVDMTRLAQIISRRMQLGA